MTPNRDADTIYVGVSCFQRAHIYHQLVGFKIHALDVMQKEDEKLSKQDARFDSSDENNALLLTKNIISNVSKQLFNEMRAMIEKALKEK